MQNGDNHLLETIKAVLMTPIHKAGYPFIAIFALVAFLCMMISATLGWIACILTLWCVYFFRDPVRVTPVREGLVVSPGDGMVQKIIKTVPPADLDLGEAERIRISIFLNVFDVHVNRIPIAGVVRKLVYIPGRFLNANLDKASEENERQLITLETGDGKTFGVVQIAGLVARRIICELREGQSVKSGERFGLIRFGSRVDIYLPEGVEPLVIEGQRAIGGETILADMQSVEARRIGVSQ